MTEEHKVMLAPSKLADVPNLDYPVLVQPKYDGFRATYIPGEGFLSRTGKKFRNKYLNEYFKSLELIGDTVLDGELYVPSTPFQELSSTLNAESVKIDVKLRFVVFDALPLDDWNKRSCELDAEDRLTLVRKSVNTVSDYNKVLDVPTDNVKNSGDLVRIYKDYLTEGLEGVMIKTKSGLYKWGRVGASGQVLKLKPFKSDDLLVTGVFDGKGKLEGTVGGIICKFGNAGDTVSVGTGFSMVDRKAISDQPDKYIGKIAEIKYLEKTKNGKSLRHPVFTRWRDDKCQ